MKTKIFGLLILLFVGFSNNSCISPERLIEKGRYDEAFNKAFSKIKSKPEKKSLYQPLREAYMYAQKRDHEKIEDLQKSGKPNIWGQIYTHYIQLNNRQNKLKELPFQVRNELLIKDVDYNSDIENARLKAAEYHYSQGKNLQSQNNKAAARQAYSQFYEVDRYIKNFKDVENLKQTAFNKGQIYAIITTNQNNYFNLPSEYYYEIQQVKRKNIEGTRTNYHYNYQSGIDYDYEVRISIREVFVSPEKIKENNYKVEKEIKDGTEPKVDQDGKVVTDSTGKVIYVPRYRLAVCYVRDIEQLKEAYVQVQVSFINTNTGNSIRSSYLDASFHFYNVASTANGELSILSNDVRRRLNGSPLPFPSDFEMLMETTLPLRDRISDYIYQNRNVIQ